MPKFKPRKNSSLPLFRREALILAATIFSLITIILGLTWSGRINPPDLIKPISLVDSVSWLFSTLKQTNSQTSDSATASPKPSVYPLAKGPQTYTFTNGDKVVGPKIKTLTVNPLCPEESTKQTVTITASHTSPIDEVAVEYITDNHTERHLLFQKSGTATEGIWEDTWSLPASHDYKYGFRLILSSADGTYDNTMWLRQ